MSVKSESRRHPEVTLPRPNFIKVFYDDHNRPVDVRLMAKPCCKDQATKAPEAQPTAGRTTIVHHYQPAPTCQAAQQARHASQSVAQPDLALKAEVKDVSDHVRVVEDQLGSFRALMARRFDDIHPSMENVVEGAIAKSLPAIYSKMEFLSKDLSSVRRQSESVVNVTRSLDSKLNATTNGILSSMAFSFGEMEKKLSASSGNAIDGAMAIISTKIDSVATCAKAAEMAANQVEDRVSVIEGEVAKSRLSEVENSAKLKDITDQVEGLKVVGIETDGKVDGLENRLADIYDIAQSLTAKMDGSESRDAQLSQEITQIEDNLAAIDNAVCETGVKQIESETLIEGLDKNVDSMNSRVNILNHAVDSLSDITDDLGSRIEKLAEGQEMAGENTVRRLEGLESKVDDLSKVADGLNAMVLIQDEMNDKIGILTSDQEKAGQELVELGAAIKTNIETKVDAIALNQSDVCDRLAGLEENQAALASSTEGLASKMAESLNAVEEKLLDSKSVNVRLCQAIDGLGDQTIGLKAELHENIDLLLVKQDGFQKKIDEEGKRTMETIQAIDSKVGEMVRESFADMNDRLDARLDHGMDIFTEKAKAGYEEAATKLVEKVTEKVNRKYDRIIARLTRKKSGPDRAKISRLLKKQIGVQDFGRMLIVTDSTNSKTCEVMFDVARRLIKDAVLAVMENRKAKGEEPGPAVRQAMAQADLVIICARYSLEDTEALRQYVSLGRKYAIVTKALRIISSNI